MRNFKSIIEFFALTYGFEDLRPSNGSISRVFKLMLLRSRPQPIKSKHLKTNLRNHNNSTQIINPNSSFLFLTTAVATNRDRGTIRDRRSEILGLSEDNIGPAIPANEHAFCDGFRWEF